MVYLGSASVVTDASGTVVGEQRYYPYGETRVPTGSMFTNKLFTGQREVTGLGIYHYGARFYSPKLGRFISADTIVPGYANPQAYNRYSYVLNNPLKYTDPTGHKACGDGENYDCNGQSQDPITNKPKKPKAGGCGGQGQPSCGGVGGGNNDDDNNPAPDPNPPPPICIGLRWGNGECVDLVDPIPDIDITIGFKSWEDIDKLDLVVDILGIVGDAAKYTGPQGVIAWSGSELLEFATISKSWDELDVGNPTGAITDIIGAAAQWERLSPVGGYLGNVVGIASNILVIEIVIR